MSLDVIMPPFALGIVLYWETFSLKLYWVWLCWQFKLPGIRFSKSFDHRDWQKSIWSEFSFSPLHTSFPCLTPVGNSLIIARINPNTVSKKVLTYLLNFKKVVIKQALMIFCYIHRSAPYSTIIKEVSSSNRREHITQRERNLGTHNRTWNVSTKSLPFELTETVEEKAKRL